MLALRKWWPSARSKEKVKFWMPYQRLTSIKPAAGKETTNPNGRAGHSVPAVLAHGRGRVGPLLVPVQLDQRHGMKVVLGLSLSAVSLLALKFLIFNF